MSLEVCTDILEFTLYPLMVITTMNIISLLNRIKSEEIVLPAIQRDFVWNQNQIYMLMDSILRGYPIGIVLMWETYNDLQYRLFDQSARSAEPRSEFLDNTNNRRLKIVLDGQQRLQSLYVALYGTYEGKFLYFDLLSGRPSDDFEEEKYFFYFMSPKEADSENEESVSQSKSEERDYELQYLVKVSDLFRKGAVEKRRLRKGIVESLKLDEEDEGRLEINVSRLDDVLTKDENILRASIIDENKTSDSANRQTESDVLEIFVRINRNGTSLSRSDLIFSMLKLNWRESAIDLPEFVASINKGNSFELDVDFVIRCLFAVSDLGTKFDIDLLRKRSNMEQIQRSFPQCCDAIRSTLDAVQTHANISSSRVLGGNANLIPFVYYFFRTQTTSLPDSEVARFRKALFLFGFARPFSRYADSRLGRFIRDDLATVRIGENVRFPFTSAVRWVNYWERVGGWNEDLIDGNHQLVHHIVQNNSGATPKHAMNARELDHIFPKSKLREKNREQAEINHFANLWLLPKGKNINKSNRHPKEYFRDVSDEEMRRALIQRELLDYRRYRNFLSIRSAAVIGKLKRKAGLSDRDFRVLHG